MKISIANAYGNVDLVHHKLDGRYAHVRGPRLQPLCNKLGIRFAPAVVAFESNRYGTKPVFDGVVVSKQSAGTLQQEIEARQARVNAPKAILRRASKHLKILNPAPAPLPSNIENVSKSLFVVNKLAKMDPDLYDLKDAVLSTAVRRGEAAVVGIHSTDYWRENWRSGQLDIKKVFFQLFAFGNHTFHQPLDEDEVTDEQRRAAKDLGSNWRSPRRFEDEFTVDSESAWLTCREYCRAA